MAVSVNFTYHYIQCPAVPSVHHLDCQFWTKKIFECLLIAWLAQSDPSNLYVLIDSSLSAVCSNLGVCLDMFVELYQDKSGHVNRIISNRIIILWQVWKSFWSLDLLEAIQGITFQCKKKMFCSIYSILVYFIMFLFQVLTCLKIVSIHIILNPNKFRQVWTCLRILWIVIICIILNLNKFREVCVNMFRHVWESYKS